ncbi:hypothetical protein [Paenibacillus thiaminolyticus]|nr:hypothetical protein [Paenibacillus thiaminolyticus]WII36828.1 hypothetical protein O0V01_24865 [Paenibacillus thiaminolyticus]
MSGGIEFEIPLIPTEEELRQMRKERTRESLQVIDGKKETTKEASTDK